VRKHPVGNAEEHKDFNEGKINPSTGAEEDSQSNMRFVFLLFIPIYCAGMVELPTVKIEYNNALCIKSDDKVWPCHEAPEGATWFMKKGMPTLTPLGVTYKYSRSSYGAKTNINMPLL